MTAIRFVIPTILINFLIDRFSRRRDLSDEIGPSRTNGDDLIKFIVNAYRARSRNARTISSRMRLIKIHLSLKSRPVSGFCKRRKHAVTTDFPLTLLPDLTSLFLFPFVSSRFTIPKRKATINHELIIAPASLFWSSSCFLPSLYYAASADITLHNGVPRAAAVYLQPSSSLPLLVQFFFKICEFVANENKWSFPYLKNSTFSGRVIKCMWKYRILAFSHVCNLFSFFFTE